MNNNIKQQIIDGIKENWIGSKEAYIFAICGYIKRFEINYDKYSTTEVISNDNGNYTLSININLNKMAKQMNYDTTVEDLVKYFSIKSAYGMIKQLTNLLPNKDIIQNHKQNGYKKYFKEE